MEPPRFLETSRASTSVRLLVVDDDDDLRESLAQMLGEHGLSVETAADASQAVRIARRMKPGIVLVDLGMPEIDGWEVIRVLRSARLTHRPYIIVMSGFTDGRSRQRAFEAGCDQYIVKESGPDALVAAVQTYLSRLDS